MAVLPDETPLDDLVAVMAHDINNPLAALATNLDFLAGALPPEASEDASEALADARMLCDMLRRLASNLDLLSRRDEVGSGKQPCDLGAFARDVVGRYEKQAEASELALVLDAETRSGEVIVSWDRELFLRALDNLVALSLERARPQSEVVVGVGRVLDVPRLVVRFDPRPSPSEVPLAPAASPALRRRRIQALSGRGLALHCARLAALLCGGRVDLVVEADGRAALCLVASGDERG